MARGGRQRPRSRRSAPQSSAGRLYVIPDYDREKAGPGTGTDPREPWRTDFRRDYARLIHCSSFRRLVGKTQLFPGYESDFFRNRLTHSLEVAQIAKSIAIRLNYKEAFLRQAGGLDTDLVEIAGLAHDLGHPPFGHNGEQALDYCMRHFGGFEGNAQTFHILSRLEKKVTTDDFACGITEDGKDVRFGLDLCVRTLAAILKYDNPIPWRRDKKRDGKVTKGYYKSEEPLVRAIKTAVGRGSIVRGRLSTVECQIMDIADDISYSTYDLEDAFKAGLWSPIQLLSSQPKLLANIASAIRNRAREIGVQEYKNLGPTDVTGVLLDVFGFLVEDGQIMEVVRSGGHVDYKEIIRLVLEAYEGSKRYAEVGYLRTSITSKFVGQFIDGVRFTPNYKNPALSSVTLEPQTWLTVEVLKRYCYESLIQSSRMKIAEQRGKKIVLELFEHLCGNGGHQLLPSDFRQWYEHASTKRDRMRVVCDFIAGMTDRYAVEFHARLTSEKPESLFKPI